MNKIYEARDDDFSFNRLRILPYKERLEYCRQHLGKEIGCGSSRIVFQIDDEWVLKLAMNNAGAAQNKAEIPDNYQNKLDIFVHVDEQRSDLDDYYFIVSEYVLPLHESDVEECTNGLIDDFNSLTQFILQSASQYDSLAEDMMRSDVNRINDDEDNYQETFWSWDEFERMIDECSLLSEINEFLTNYQFNGFSDWLGKDNLGMALRNGKPCIVFLDSGFNRDIARKYYGVFGDLGSWNDINEHLDMFHIMKECSDAYDSKYRAAIICYYFKDYIKKECSWAATKVLETNFNKDVSHLSIMLKLICTYETNFRVGYWKALRSLYPIGKNREWDLLLDDMKYLFEIDYLVENKLNIDKIIYDSIEKYLIQNLL